MHRLLSRQLRKLKLKPETLPSQDEWERLLTQVNSSYEAADQDRYTLERSLTISSEEMQAMYESQRDSLEGRLQSVVDALPDVLFLIDEDTRCLEIMSGNKKLMEERKEQGLGKLAYEVYPKHIADGFRKVIDQALEEDRLCIVNFDLPIDGMTRHFEGRVMPSNYIHEGKRTVVFNSIDITKRVTADIQGRLISTMFESSKEGMLILDHRLRAISYNRAFCDLTGESASSIGSRMPNIVRSMLKRPKGKMIRRSIKKDGSWLGEITGYHKDGKAYPLWLTINSVRDNSDQVINYVVMLSDVSEIKRSQEELEHVATHDALTNLPNRVLFHDRLEQAVRRAARTESIGALFFLDLDRFKNINDNLGHLVGDDLLIQASERLGKVCRSSDTLARLGGDEFTLIVEGLKDTDELPIIADKILDEFKAPFVLGGYNLDISVSIGISVFPRDSNDPIELIKHADTAMYSAKESGRNTYQFYRQELTSSAFEYFATEIALRKALVNEEFFLVYQPQYDIDGVTLIGVEALIRWKHPDLGVVSPAAFIPIAETNGQIVDIGDWVIAESVRQCAEWQKLHDSEFTVSINLSRKQLMVPELAKKISKILDEHDVTPESLEFEITESAIIEDKNIASRNIEEIKQLGITMAIDDFGTGFSSLVNLKQFPLSRLKIDQSFVRDVTKDSNDEAIIRATIALAKSLQLKVIAEGVEKIEQLQFLREEGCDQVQGYYFSEPVLPDDITSLMVRDERRNVSG